MISIITKSGVSLDLAPDFEFQMEIEQPLLSDDRMPVPFTTDIAFLPTETNKQVFQYIPLMMLEPKVRKIDATIFAAGYPITRGHLVYSAIEDGAIKYTFTGSEITDSWSGIIEYEKSVEYDDAVEGFTDFACSPIINEYAVARVRFSTDQESSPIATMDKYRNYKYATEYPVAAPILQISKLLSKIGLRVNDFPDSVSSSIATMGILCQYKSVAIKPETRMDLNIVYLKAENEPKVTYADIVKELLAIHCCAIYSDGGRLVIKSANDILDSEPSANLDGKISDVFVSGIEPKHNYKFSYNGHGGDKFNADSINESDGETSANNIVHVGNLYGLMQRVSVATVGKYASYSVDTIGDTYSIRRHSRSGGGAVISPIIDADIIYCDEGICEHNVGADDDIEVKSEWDLVKCTVDCVFIHSASVISPNYIMAPVIPAQSTESERSQKVYIGLICPSRGPAQKFSQFVDKGHFFGNGEEAYIGTSLSPGYMYETYHKKLAEWYGRDRQYIQAELNLSAQEISMLTMSRPVYFYGRKWMIKKITMTFRADSNRIETTGEFISMSGNEEE